MKHIDFKLGDKTYALSFTAEALFTLYDKFGVTGDILGTTHILEPTAEGWKNCCWLAALMASQGELQRRYMGETPQKMLTVEELRRSCIAADAAALRRAVRGALEQGFKREVEEDEEEEVNLVLLEREQEVKKAVAQGKSELLTWLGRLRSSITRSETRSS